MSLKDLSDYTVYSRYAHYIPELKRRETWDEIVDRVFGMHERKYKNELEADEQFKKDFYFSKEMVRKKRVLGSQRALQFGGKWIEKENLKIYNCSFTHLDRTSAFSEIFYALLCGVGVGYSVQKHHVEKLPEIKIPQTTSVEKIFVIEDSIIGWSDALAALMSSFFVSNQKFPEFAGTNIKFDYSKIRPEGALIAGQFKAPGHKGLQSGLEKIRSLLLSIENNKLSPINCYDIICHTSDCVLSGGIRRAASLCLFSKEDTEMMQSKTGNWYIKNPQRARSNNSVILERDKITESEFNNIFKNIKEYGEPAFYFTSDLEVGPNPCVAPETHLLTRDGYKQISSIVNTEIEIWNGSQWSKSFIAKTGENQKLLKVTVCTKTKNTTDDKILFATSDHKWYDINNKEIRTKDLKIGLKLLVWSDPESKYLVTSEIKNIEDINRYDDTYCVNEPKKHLAVFNGILTGQCVEISMYPKTVDGRSGIQGCNLTEINGKYCTTEQSFYDACYAASFIGTLQAGYTNFNYLSKETKEIFEKEALLGVSLTGWMENPEILFKEDILKRGAEIVKTVNQKTAKSIKINPAARTCCVKPAGSTSCVLETSSGIHPHHSKRYIRNVQANKNEFAIQYFKKINPIAVQESVWSANKTDNVISFSCEVPKGSIIKNNINAVSFLEKIKFVQQNWVISGNTKELSIRNCDHNVSCTVVINDNEWKDVENFIFNNREFFTGISLISSSGDLDYRQAPFTTVLTDKEIVEKYGNGSLLASGLIVDGINAFDNDLYSACEAVLGITKLSDLKEIEVEPKKPSRKDFKSEKEYSAALVDYSIKLNIFFQNKGEIAILEAKYDWIRRAKQFAERYFHNDIKLMTYCLKHVDIWKKYLDINRENKSIDWSKVVEDQQELISADSLAAQSCAGGACNLSI